jgi:hypothetical protein
MTTTSASQYSIKDRFQWVTGYTYPVYKTWTDAVPVSGTEPSIDTGVESIRVVADLNNDGFDDVVIDNSDVRETKPIILFSNGDGTFNDNVTIIGTLIERTNREVKAADLNADGLLDLVFFPAPHGWKKDTLGPNWDATDPQIVLINQGGKRFKLVTEIYTAKEGYFHSGEVADLNGDGRLDILPLDEYPPYVVDLGGGSRIPYLQQSDGSFKLASSGLSRLFDRYQTPNIGIGDINGDGIDDFVIAINEYDSGKTYDLSSPTGLKPLLAYALGQRGVALDNLVWQFGGKHWIDQAKIDKIHALGGTWIDPHSQLANIQDLDGDGVNEIITSELIYTNATSTDTGGAIGVYRWSASGLLNVTQEFFPFQPSREDGWFMEFSLKDLNGDGLKDFVAMSTPSWSNPYTAQVFMNEGGKFLPTFFENIPRTDAFGKIIRNLSGDFNGDGAPDIVGLSRKIESDGQGGFISKQIGVITLLNNDLPARLKNLSSVGKSGNEVFGNFTGLSIRPSGGDDVVNGSPDIVQTAYFWGVRQDYKLERSGSEIRVDARLQNEGIDVLKNIERLSFSDVDLAFDTAGSAGKAYRVYKAAFARDPISGDKAGLGYWIHNIDRGMDMVEVAARFVDSKEFRDLYGTNPTNAQFLTKLYENVLARAPEATGYNWWLNELNTNPSKTKAKVLADFSESGENQTGVAALIGNGITYEPWVG